MKIEERFAVHPDDFRTFDTHRIRKEFLIDKIFAPDSLNLVYSFYDRFITGGVMPVKKQVSLQSFDTLKSSYFLERRELGVINVGGKGFITADGEKYSMNSKDALYLGKETKEISFSSESSSNPAKFYLNSTQAHHKYPSRLISFQEAEKAVLGSPENANHRQLNKLIVNSILPTCQIQMGLTELKTGSIWNTMPVHTHNRRMEVYFYFELAEDQGVCHLMGQIQETRHLWLKNEQAAISPPWSVHSGAGTASYSFIWGMAGENLDYGDMDVSKINEMQ